MEECIVIIMIIAWYLLFNVILTMLIERDRPIKYKSSVIVLILFGLPILIITIVIAIIIAVINSVGGGS